jgi:uncharacterized membrane protein YcaP (DUF421 family)
VGEKEVFFLTFMFVFLLDQAVGSMEMSFLAFFDVIIVLAVAESCGRFSTFHDTISSFLL